MSKGRSRNSGKSGNSRNNSKQGALKGKRTSGNTGGKKINARDKRKYIDHKDRLKKGDPLPSFNEDEIRLNKYLANAGVCSRREADVLIKTGVVTVNGEVITEMGYKVKPGDVVKYDGESINAETKRYVLLNKPKGFTTLPNNTVLSKTALGLVSKACKESLFPVDRLEKESTGLILFTNDTDLEKKLLHPKHRATKLYHVELSKRVAQEDLEKLVGGIALDDGTVSFSKAEIVADTDFREVGVELRSGKSQVVARAFEKLGYGVKRMDRVMFAGLTKKDLPRGMYRHLSEKEVSFLKMK